MKTKIEQYFTDVSPPSIYKLSPKSIKITDMQKILFFFLCLTFYSLYADSQINKNNWMIGGNISYSRTNYNSQNYGAPHTAYNLQIKPNIGYFVADKLAIGLKVGIDKSGSKDANTTFYLSYTDFNIGPFIRYYLLSKERTVNLLTEAAYQYGFEGGNYDKTSKNSFTFSAGPVAYFNSSVGLEFLITYSTYKFSGINGSNGTIQFGFGLQVHLEKDK
ncbi:MAG: outer membrane beta-barrel protein [Sphingobacteriales bacterium]